jgi:hypothetical protein
MWPNGRVCNDYAVVRVSLGVISGTDEAPLIHPLPPLGALDCPLWQVDRQRPRQRR